MRKEHLSIRYGKRQKRAQGHFFRDKIIAAGLLDKDGFYLWLAHELNLSRNECHFSRMASADIVRAIHLSINFLNRATEQRLTDYPIFEVITQNLNQYKCEVIPRSYRGLAFVHEV